MTNYFYTQKLKEHNYDYLKNDNTVIFLMLSEHF